MGQAGPGCRPLPPIAYSQRMEAKREGPSCCARPRSKGRHVGLDKMCLLMEVRLWETSGYNHLPSTTSATPTTVAATNAASNVATNTKGILACLGHLL